MEKPWGRYEVLIDEPEYKVKRITLHPNQQFSLQYHNHRWEDWIIVEGAGKIRHGDYEDLCVPGDTFHIKPKQIHRATANALGLVFIEVQRGKCYEEDIVRLEDDYGRIGT